MRSEVGSACGGAALALVVGLTACQGVPDDKLIDLSDDGSADAGGDTDGGSPLPSAPTCSAVAQNCDVGEKCTALRSGDAQDRYNCVTDDGVLNEGDACVAAPSSGQDSCRKGLVCVSGSFELADGACLELCETDLQCSSGRCVDDANTGVRHCAPDCDPFGVDCPAARQDCLATDSGFNCRHPGEQDQAGLLESCDSFIGIGCQEGLVCVQGGVLIGCQTPFCCAELCNLDVVDMCEGATACIDLGADQGNIGACTVPQ